MRNSHIAKAACSYVATSRLTLLTFRVLSAWSVSIKAVDGARFCAPLTTIWASCSSCQAESLGPEQLVAGTEGLRHSVQLTGILRQCEPGGAEAEEAAGDQEPRKP